MGKSSGFLLVTIGGSMSLGNLRVIWPSLDCTSCIAPSMLREMSNSTETLPEPVVAVEVIAVTPSIEDKVSSTSSSTSLSTASAEAPSQVIETLTTGKSTSGN